MDGTGVLKQVQKEKKEIKIEMKSKLQVVGLSIQVLYINL